MKQIETPLTRPSATLSPLKRGEGSRGEFLRPAKRGEEPALSERSESKGAAKRRMRGYSLVEVLIAIAITSVVLLTVVTLFYMGQRNVYSGKQMTYAVSVGTRMLEDLSTMTSSDVESNFNIDDTTPMTTVTVSGITAAGGGIQTFTNSAKRDTSGCTSTGTPPVYTCPNDTGGYLAKWAALIDESKLTNARLGLIVTPRSPVNPASCNACPWTTARFVKVRAYVSWEEAKNRRRIAFFDTTKVNRTGS